MSQLIGGIGTRGDVVVLPDFVVIGAQKSASTFLQIALADHPEIFMPTGELPFFETPDYIDGNLDALVKQFKGRSERRLGFKRPSYLARPEVPARLAQNLPEAQFIAVLRDPIERTVSAYYHYIRYRSLPPLPIESGLRKILHSRRFCDQYRRAGEILEFGLYGKAIARYSHFFDLKSMQFLLHDEISQTPVEAVQAVYAFLGVDPLYVPSTLDSRPQRVTYNLFRLRLASSRSRLIYEYNEDRTRLTRRESLSLGRRLAAAGVGTFDLALEPLLPNKRPSLSPELEDELRDFFSADLELTEEYIGRSLRGWRTLRA